MPTGLPLDRDAFTTHIASALAQEPDTEVLSQDTLTIEARAQGVNMRLGLDNQYAQYLRAPEVLDRLTALIVAQSRSGLAAMQMPDLTQAAEQLYPQIKPQVYVDSLRAQGIPPLVARPFVADLALTYTMDRPDSMIPITTRHTAAWHIDELTLYQMAMANLEQRETQYAVYGQGPQQIFICQSLDGYDATRILLGGLLDEWAESIRPHRLLLGVPNRDFLIGFPESDAEIVKQIAAQVRRDAASREYSLTSRIFVWENGALREYAP